MTVDSDTVSLRSKKSGGADVLESHLLFLKRLSRLAGFLPLTTSTTTSSRVVNIIYYITIELFLLHMAILSSIDIYIKWDGDHIRTAYTLVNTVSYICLVMMEVYYQTSSYRLLHILDITQTHFSKRSGNRARERRARRICIALCFFTVFAILQWALDPLLQIVLRGQELQLPLQLWYPWDVRPLRRAVPAFAMQAIAQCFFAVIACAIACLHITFTLLACGQFDVLCDSVRNSWFNGLLLARVKPSMIEIIDLEQNRVVQLRSSDNHQIERQSYKSNSMAVLHTVGGEIDFKQYEDEVLASIKECVEHHLLIREFCMCLRVYFDYPLALQIASLVVVITTALYAAVDNFEFKTFQYAMVGLIHLFTFCYCGTSIYNESTRPAEAAWQARWWSGTKRAAASLQVLMVHAGRPLQLTAGPFFCLNLTNFLSALKMCWSVYTLLNNMKVR